MKLLKYAVGIDISKDTIHCCFGNIDTAQTISISKAQTFCNTPNGFHKLLQWSEKLREQSTIECWFFCEATGVYYEQLAFFLCEHNKKLAVALPTAVRDFAKSTSIKTKTDAVDAAMLTRMALERKLSPWEIPTTAIRQLKLLSRERQTLVDAKTALSNRIHALEHSYKPMKQSLRRLAQQRKLLNKQILQIEQELRQIIDEDPLLKERITNAASIQGVGLITVVTLLAETNGFALAKSAKQVLSYAGLDIVTKQSGTSAGKPHISKRGNARIRRALYTPAMTAIRYNLHLKAFFDRIVQRNGAKKMPALIAVARKLLRLIFTLFRNNTPYQPISDVLPN